MSYSKKILFLLICAFLCKSAPGVALSATIFPFDTIFINYAKLSGNTVTFDTAPVTVSRYGLSFVLYRYPYPTVCPTWYYADFKLTLNASDTSTIKFPQGSRLMDFYENNNCITTIFQIDTSYKTHEYRFKVNSSTLYMQVLDSSKPDSVKVRFDTASFLGRAQVVVPGRKNKESNPFVSLSKDFGGTSRFYDITGRNIRISPVMSRNRRGIIIEEHIDANGGKLFLKHCFFVK